MAIDLHLHSTASDGTESPAGVVAAAARAGLSTLALTDHDTTAGWEEAAGAARRFGVLLVPGAEISCQAGGIGVHMLSYLHDPGDIELLRELSRTRDDRLHRARRMVEAIGLDHDLSWADVEAQVGPDATVGRPHIADALVANGVVRHRDEAFDTLLHNRSKYYLRHYAPDATEMVRTIRAAGGVPVMAHPCAGRRGRTVGDDVIESLARAGLAGLEADHRDHEPEERLHLHGLAEDLGILATGSSDYHGTGKLNRIGENTTSPEVLEAIVAQGTGATTFGG